MSNRSHKGRPGFVPAGAARSDRAYDFAGLLTYAEVMARTGLGRCAISARINAGGIRVVSTPLGCLYEEEDVDRIAKRR